MDTENLQTGDVVYARVDLHNDGHVPGYAADALLAPAGSPGMVVQTGYAEQAPEETIILVRFQDEQGQLGPPLGCIPEELTQEPPE